MALTFLNLVVVGGVLVGLTAGASLAYREQYSGDVLVRPEQTKDVIERSDEFVRTARTFPEVRAVSPRYIVGGRVEANYQSAVGPKDYPDAVSVNIAGIDPSAEHLVTELGARLLEGEYLGAEDDGYVLLGKNLVEKYTVGAGPVSVLVLGGVETGSKVRITVNGKTQEYLVKGIVRSKTGEVSQRVFMLDSELRKIIGRPDRNVGEIAISLTDPATAVRVRDGLLAAGFADVGRIETARESQGTFLDDIEQTFRLLSDMIGVIGLIVASITVFIVVFINAVTRRKFIGILKGVGISALAIESSYVIQSLVYALVGSLIGLGVVYGIIAPYVIAHPIDFPFSDGLLLVPIASTLVRAGLLIFITVLAGYIPARMIVQRNTLDAILGR
jgi:ABC-type lipoprotein release transport system permease subunit